MQQCLVCLPVSQRQGPGTGSTIQGVPDLGLLAVGTCFDGEQAGGWTLVVQYGYLDWTRGKNGGRLVPQYRPKYWIYVSFSLEGHRLKYY